MRILVQIVSQAKLRIHGQEISKIDHGFVIFVGFTHSDTIETINKAALKISKLRIFPDVEGKTNLSISDVGGQILSVSQFTLYANATAANRPSFSTSMAGDQAKEHYIAFNEALRDLGFTVKEGIFGEYMEIEQTNDGPFSLQLEF